MNAPQIQARPIPDLYRRFQPWMIPGLGLDLDASYGVLNSISPDVPATNGQTVRRWLDKSGNGRNYNQAVAASQPVLLSAGLNGLPAILSDGVNDVMTQSSGLDIARNVPGVTMFVVSKAASDTLSADDLYISISTNATGTRAGIGRQASEQYNVLGRRLNGDTLQRASYGPISTNPIILSGVTNFAEAVANLYLDGALVSTLNPFQTPGLSSDTDSLSVAILGFNSSFFYAGVTSRILVWPRALTAEELGKVHAYLSQTYGIPLAS